MDGRQINFVIDSGSPITIIPNHLKPDKPLRTVEQIYTDVNKNRTELDGKCMVTVETPNGPKQLELIISKRNDFTPLVGLNWFEELQIEIRTNNSKAQIKTVQSENVRQYMHKKFRKLFEENTTSKRYESENTTKTGHKAGTTKSPTNTATFTRRGRKKNSKTY